MHGVWPVLKGLLFIALVAYGLVVAAMYLGQRSLLYPGASSDGTRPSGAAPWGEWSFITTPDGERLAALHDRAAGDGPTILFFPGNGDDIVHYGFLADRLRAHGIGLLALSYRGYPGSTGRPSETGLLTDGIAAFDRLAAAANGPVVLLGRSLGTGVAVNTAAEREAAALVLVSAYDSIRSVAAGIYWYLPVSMLIADPFRSDRRITRVTEPKLFLHGDADRLIPAASGRALFDAAPEPKLWSGRPRLGHNDIWAPDVIDEIAAFVLQQAASQ